MKIAVLCVVVFIGYIVCIIVANNNGYKTGFDIATKEAKDDYDNLLRNYTLLNDDWKKECSEMENAYKAKCEAYERQINVLKQMLEKERGEK